MVNLVIADDHAVLRQALCELLATRGNYQVVAQAQDGEELLTILDKEKPDIIIMDLSMPKVDGLQALNAMSNWGSCPPVLMLSADQEGSKVKAALRAGAKGYVPKNADIQELEFAIAAILAGKTYLSPSLTDAVIKADESGSPDKQTVDNLTSREREILALITAGQPNRTIAKMLHISTRTVDTHRSNILKKLKVKTNAELVKIAISAGITTL